MQHQQQHTSAVKSLEHAMRATWSCLSAIYYCSFRHNEETEKRKRWFWTVQSSYHSSLYINTSPSFS